MNFYIIPLAFAILQISADSTENPHYQDFPDSPTESPYESVENKTQNGNDTEVVGGTKGLLRLQALQARAKAQAHALAVKTKAQALAVQAKAQMIAAQNKAQAAVTRAKVKSLAAQTKAKTLAAQAKADSLAAQAKTKIISEQTKARAHLEGQLFLHRIRRELLENDGEVPWKPGKAKLIKPAGQQDSFLNPPPGAASRSATSYEDTLAPLYSTIPSVVISDYYRKGGRYPKKYGENLQPSFSIIPTSWKPPSGSNLYGNENNALTYKAEIPFTLNVLPGKWRNLKPNHQTYYQDYQVIPISYEFTEGAFPGRGEYGRSAESTDVPEERFADVKDRLRGWENNPRVWRPDSPQPEQVSGPNPHLHHHLHHEHQHLGHNKFHTIVHQHVFTHEHKIADKTDFPEIHHAAPLKPHLDFQQSIVKPIVPHEHQLIINKQTVIVPPKSGANFQISQVAGNHNSLSQSQASNQHQWNGQNFQSAQIAGHNNAMSQSQASSSQTPIEPFLGEPHLINVPHWENIWRTNSGAPQVPAQSFVQKRSVDSKIGKFAQQNNQLCCQTEIEPILLKEEHKECYCNRMKRAIPLLRLIADPNAKLDVPKTLENIGSARDAFLSTLRVPPQNLFIPSRYQIVDRQRQETEGGDGERIVEAINPAVFSDEFPRKSLMGSNQDIPRPNTPLDSFDFSNTHKQIGSMLRESVRSGKDTLSHVGEVYHSARKALASSRNVAPRILMSSLHIPAIQRSEPLVPQNDKLLLITPKLLQLKQEGVGAAHYADNNEEFVGVPDVMDSLGLTNRYAEDVGLRRIVFHPISRNPFPDLQDESNFIEDGGDAAFDDSLGILQKKPNMRVGAQQSKRKSDGLSGKFRKYYVLTDTLQKQASKDFQETLEALDNAKQSVGATNLKDFVLKMKDDVFQLIPGKLEEAKKIFDVHLASPVVNLDFRRQHLDPANPKSVESNFEGVQENFVSPQTFTPEEQRQVSSFLSDLFRAKAEGKIRPVVSSNADKNSEGPEVVGGGLPLARQLLRPFMGQPSQSERRTFFEEYGDVEELENNAGGQPEDLTSAINPVMFRKLVNESLETVTPVNLNESTVVPDGLKALEELRRNLKLPHLLRESAPVSNSEEDSKNRECTPSEGNTQVATSLNLNNSARNLNKDESVDGQERNFDINNKTNSVGTSMSMGKELLTPFMGKIKDKDVEIYLEKYNNHNNYIGDDSRNEMYIASPESSNLKNINEFHGNWI